jgi:fatty-acyl-CoA synthase
MDCVDSQFLAEHNVAMRGETNSAESQKRETFFVNCGEPLPGYEIEIRDELDRVLPERHCGKLFVMGPSVMQGYFGDNGITHEVLSGDGWLNTGDLAYRVGNTLVIAGRVKDMIIINGRNIWPQDLEFLADRQPEIRNACAVSVPGEGEGELAVLLIECRNNKPGVWDDLVKHLRGLIHAEIGIDCKIEIVPRNSIPRTTSGKLARSAMRTDYINRTAATAGEVRNSKPESR